MSVKVCLLIDSLGPNSGNELLLMRMVRQLDPKVIEVHVCCLEASERLANLEPAVKTAIFPTEKIFSVEGVRQMRRFRRYVQEHGIDVIHSFVDKLATFSVLAAIGGGRAVVTSRLNCGYGYTAKKLRTWRFLNRCSTHILANSFAAKRAAVAAEKVSPDKITVLYQGVDLERFAPSAGDVSRAALEGLEPGMPVVGIVANFRPVKNVALFVRAAAEVAAAVPEARFLLVGQGPLKGELQELARSLGLAGRVYFSRAGVAVCDYLAALSVACLSSVSESLPNAILEYMACGLPVVATGVGGIPELVRDGENGYLVTERTPQAFAGPIIRLLQDPELGRTIGRRGLERARAEFDGREAVKRQAQFYVDAVASVRKGRPRSETAR